MEGTSPNDAGALAAITAAAVIGVLGSFIVVVLAVVDGHDKVVEAGFLRPEGVTGPPAPFSGRDGRSRFRVGTAASATLAFAPLTVALSSWWAIGSGPATILLAEACVVVWLAVTHMLYGQFMRRLKEEAGAGYCSFDTTPLGIQVEGLWTRLGTSYPSPPRPLNPSTRPPTLGLDPAVEDALDSTLEVSSTEAVSAALLAPPTPAPGISAHELVVTAKRLAGVPVEILAVTALPAMAMTTGDVRSALITAGFTLSVVMMAVSFGVARLGVARAYAERRHGYTTLAGREPVWVGLNAYTRRERTAWQLLSTDQLWHLDAKTGAVLRPPLDPMSALADPRVQAPRWHSWD